MADAPKGGIHLQFEWDNDKAASNVEKHGVSFEETATVFRDPFALIFDDEAHAIEEHRERLSRLLAKSRSLKSHLPVIWPEEYRRARRKAQRQTDLPLSTFPEVCPWTAAQVLDEEFWPEIPADLREGA